MNSSSHNKFNSTYGRQSGRYVEKHDRHMTENTPIRSRDLVNIMSRQIQTVRNEFMDAIQTITNNNHLPLNQYQNSKSITANKYYDNKSDVYRHSNQSLYRSGWDSSAETNSEPYIKSQKHTYRPSFSRGCISRVGSEYNTNYHELMASPRRIQNQYHHNKYAETQEPK